MATVHVARTDNGDVQCVTANDSQAHMLAAEGLNLDINTPVARLMEEGLLGEKAHDVMDDETWKIAALELKGYQNLSSDNPLYAVNPPDMPSAVAEQRLQIVMRFMGDEDVQAYLELNEVIMANNAKRAPDLNLFSPPSKNASFNRIYNNDIAAVETWYREAKELSEEHPPANPGASTITDSILLQQQIAELSFVLDEMDAMQPSLMPSAG